ncbi:MAG TPA: single-stranded DNA-binding protein [Chitinophagaceae bacterium]|nr:single-stranded DNA-binding protein [Chitinophagaceae bacterium]
MQNNSIIGNLVKKPILNKGANGPWTKIRVAENETSDETLYVDVFYSGKLAEQITQYLDKGRGVYVEYRLKNGKYTKDGIEINTIDLYGTKCIFL